MEKIICDKCGNEISIDEVFKKKIDSELKEEYTERKKKMEDHFQKEKEKNETEINREKEKFVKEKEEIRKKIEEEERKKNDFKMKELEAIAREKEEKINSMASEQVELRKKQRELEEQKRDMENEMEKRYDIKRRELEEKMKDEFSRNFNEKLEKERIEREMKEREKDKYIEDLKKSLEETRRKAEQGSMELQGEVQEQDLREILRREFVYDEIKDVPKGSKGADILQEVKNQFGEIVGKIVWESKNTKDFSNEWLEKLHYDKNLVGGDIGILATKAMPNGIKNFGNMKGIWVVRYDLAVYVCNIIRENIIAIDNVKKSNVGKDQKMEILYNYLVSSRFRNHFEAIIRSYGEMRDQLEKEKKVIQASWAKRNKDIDLMLNNSTTIYGDLRSIIGGSIKIESMEMDNLLPGIE